MFTLNNFYKSKEWEDLDKKIIEKKYYDDRTIIENKLNVFYAMSKITDEEYSNLVLKVEEVYASVETIEEVQAKENVESVVK